MREKGKKDVFVFELANDDVDDLSCVLAPRISPETTGATTITCRICPS